MGSGEPQQSNSFSGQRLKDAHAAMQPYLSNEHITLAMKALPLATGLIGFLGGLGAAYWRRRAFSQRIFLGTLNLSLNSYDGKRFAIRTLAEVNVQQGQVLTKELHALLAKAAARVTETDPVVRSLPPEELWLVNNRIANLASSVGAAGFLARDLGLSVREEPYVMVLTAEKANVRQQKLRAFLLRRSLVATLADWKGTPPIGARSGDALASRWALLGLLSKQYCAEVGLTAKELSELPSTDYPKQPHDTLFWNLHLCMPE